MSEMIAMAMPSAYFATIVREYANWREKWWREAVQNAVDAKADNIELGAVREGETWRVWCEDDGCGMDEDTLMNVFLTFGGTSKTGDDGKAGGFGKAKELLLMPWVEWRVVSRGYEVRGKHNCKSMPKFVGGVPGTRIEVVMPDNNRTNIDYAKSWLGKCTLPSVTIRVNDGSAVTEVEAMRSPGKVVLGLERADIRHNKSSSDNRLLVRSNGLCMHEEYLPEGVPGSVCVELKGKSVELLTANRDGLADSALSDQIRQFVNSVAVNKVSALKGGDKRLMIWHGSGNFQVDARRERCERAAKKAAKSVSPRGAAVSLDEAAVKEMLEAAVAESGNATFSAAPDAAVRMLSAVKFETIEQVTKAATTLAWQPDFIVVNNAGGKVHKRFTPEHMTPAVVKLAVAWTEICRFVLIQLGCSAEFGVGFVFGDEMAALVTESGRKWLVINPMQHGSVINPVKSVDQIYASAVHECTHLADSIRDHDERFASALTDNFAKCSSGWPKALKVIRDSIRRGSPKTGRG